MLIGCTQFYQDKNEVESTSTPTMMPSTTSTATPIVTPTPQIPILLGTPSPNSSSEILEGNVSNIQNIAIINGFPTFQSAVSKDGNYLYIATTEGIYIYDTFSKTLIQRFDAYIDCIDCYGYPGGGWRGNIDISDDGKRFVVSNIETIQVWSIEGFLIFEKPRETYETEHAQGTAPVVNISPDGSLITFSDFDFNRFPQRIFQIINVDNKNLIYEWDGQGENLNSKYEIEFSHDNSIIETVDYINDEVIFRFWSTVDFKEIPKDDVRTSNAFSNGDLQYAEFENGFMIVRDKLDKKILYEVQIIQWNNEWQDYVERGYAIKFAQPLFSSDGKKAITLDYYEYNSGPYKWNYFPHLNNDYVKSISLWNLETEKKISQKNVSLSDLSSVIISDDGSIINYLDGFFDAATAWMDYNLIGNLRFISNDLIVFTPQFFSKWVSMGNDSIDEPYQCSIDLNLSQLICPLHKAYDLVGGIKLLNQNITKGRIYGIFQDLIIKREDNNRLGEIEVWDDSRKVQVLGNSVNFYEQKYAAFADIYIDNYSIIYIYDIQNRDIVFEKKYPVWSGHTPVFNFDGNTIAVLYYENHTRSNHHYIEFINFTEKKIVSRIKVNATDKYYPEAISYSLDGKLIAISYRDGTIRIIRTEDGNVIREWKAHNTRIIGLSFSPDGKRIISMDEVSFIKVWGVPPFNWDPISLSNSLN